MNKSKKIIVCGATGFVGRSLIPALLKEDYEVSVLGRDRHKLQSTFPNQSIHLHTWDDLDTLVPDNYAAIINLTGENIGDGLWSKKKKQTIINSRVEATKKIVQWCAKSSNKLPHIYNASAIGIYGTQINQHSLPPALNESDAQTTNSSSLFLVEVGQAWERATFPAIEKGHPVTLMRFGVVIKKGEGMLKKLQLPYSLGVGSVIGTGYQAISWIYIVDLVNAILFLLKHPDILGPVNLCSPGCVSQKAFASALASSLHRPLIFTLPAYLIKMLFGQMGEELLLSGQHVAPSVLNQAGFVFSQPNLKLALEREFGKS